MLFAVLTLLLWTGAGYASSRTACLAGSLRANRWRLSLASLPLAAVVLLWAEGPLIPGWIWFAAGGFFHLGLGDVGLFAAYRRLGPRLGLLICLCLVPPFAGLLEWLWMGVHPSAVEGILALVVLASVAFALAPTERSRLSPRAWWWGILGGVLAALGQAMGAVVTRRGYALYPQTQAFDAAFLRVFTGAMILTLIALVLRMRTPAQPLLRSPPGIAPWLLASILLGPCLGIPAYQAALASTPAALVQAVIAAMPITIIPLAYLIDKDRPSLRALIGGLIAVSATAAMLLLQGF